MSDLQAPQARRRPLSMYAGTGLALAPGSPTGGATSHTPSPSASAQAKHAHASALASLTGGNSNSGSSSPSPFDQSPTPSKLKRLSLVASRSTTPRRRERERDLGGSRDGGDIMTSSPSASSPRPAFSPRTSPPHSPSLGSSLSSSPSSPTPTSTATCTPTSIVGSGARSGAGNGDRLPTIRAPPAAASPTPRRSRPSSISYSPANAPNVYALGSGSPSLRRFDQRRMSMEVSSATSAAADSRDRDGTATPPAVPTVALTLAEKHADLLRTIAMRERRVNDLRQELATQEQALAVLRSRWTSIARDDALQQGLGATSPPSQAPLPLASASGAAHTAAVLGEKAAAYALSSTTSAGASVLGAFGGRSLGAVRAARTSGSGSSSSSLPTVPDDEPPPMPARSSQDGGDTGALSNIWSAITADADETIQEGKRFWGSIMRSVSSATATVPEEAGEERPQERRSEERRSEESSRRFSDLAGLRTMLPVSLGSFGGGGQAAKNSHPLSMSGSSGNANMTTSSTTIEESPVPIDAPVPASPPQTSNSTKRNSIRLQRPALTPGPHPLVRMSSGASNASHGSDRQPSLLDDSDEEGPAGGVLQPVRKSPVPSPQRSPVPGTPIAQQQQHSPASPRPLTVLLDGVLW